MFNSLSPFLENNRIGFFEDLIEKFVINQVLLAPLILLFLEESGIPLPVPGDVYLTFLGYQVSIGNIPFFEAFILSMAAILMGASILYFISARWGNFLLFKFGKYIHVNEKRLAQVEKKFKKYGVLVIIFGRHVPGFRVPITVFSAMSGVPYPTFISSTFISVIFWVAIYLTIGKKIGKSVFRLFHSNPIYFIIIIILILLVAGIIIYKQITNPTKD